MPAHTSAPKPAAAAKAAKPAAKPRAKTAAARAKEAAAAEEREMDEMLRRIRAKNEELGTRIDALLARIG